MSSTPSTPAARGSGDTPRRLMRLTSAVFGIGILIQAILASFGLFDGRPGWIDIHQVLGMTLLVVVVVQAAAAIPASQRGLVPRQVLVISLVLVVLVVAQLGLGFSTRESSVAIAWHISLGVGLMALTVANEMLISFAPRLLPRSQAN